MADPRAVRNSQIFAALLYWVAIPGLVLATGAELDALLDLPRIHPHTALVLVALGLIVAGVALIARATRDLRVHGGGTPNPLDPPLRLVQNGSYGFCRHPMFLGYDLSALGFLLLVRSAGALLISFPVFLLCEIWFLRRREERSLERRFPREFPLYCARVPFLLPRLPRSKEDS